MLPAMMMTGIVSCDGDHFHGHRALGHVAGNFDKDDIIRALAGSTIELDGANVRGGTLARLTFSSIVTSETI